MRWPWRAAIYVGSTIAAVAADTAAGSFIGAVTVSIRLSIRMGAKQAAPVVEWDSAAERSVAQVPFNLHRLVQLAPAGNRVAVEPAIKSNRPASHAIVGLRLQA